LQVDFAAPRGEVTSGKERSSEVAFQPPESSSKDGTSGLAAETEDG